MDTLETSKVYCRLRSRVPSVVAMSPRAAELRGSGEERRRKPAP